MTRLHTLGLALLMAASASILAQDKAAPSAAAKPAVTAPAAAAPAAAPATTPTAASPAAIVPAAKPAAGMPAASTTASVPAAEAPASRPAAAPAPVIAEKSAAPAKKRVAKRKPNTACTKLDDPWDNVCQIRKHAEMACKDLPDGKKAARTSRKDKAAPVTSENRRKQCVDNYMRNV